MKTLVSSAQRRNFHLSRCVEEGRAGAWECWPGCTLQAHRRSPGSVQTRDWQHHRDSRSLCRGHRPQAQAACAMMGLLLRGGCLHTVQHVLFPCQRALPGCSSSRQIFEDKAGEIPVGAACQPRPLAVPWSPPTLPALVHVEIALLQPAPGSSSLHKKHMQTDQA